MSGRYKTTDRRIVSSYLFGEVIQSGILYKKMGTYIQWVKESEFSRQNQAFPLSENIVTQIADLGCILIMLVVEKQGEGSDIYLTNIWTFLEKASGSLRKTPLWHSWWYLPLKFWEKIHLGQTNDSD